MRTLVRSLNILIAVLASCVLGLVLYGVLRPPAAVSATEVLHTEELAQAPDQETTDGENQAGDLWQQGLEQTEQGNWAVVIDDLEGALEQSPETPERYLLLAQAYREAERDDDAAEVLRRGMEATGSEELRLPLKAVESTLEMPEDQRTCLNALYHAASSGEEAAFSAALEDWENGLEVRDEEGNYTQNPLWAETGNLAWDGGRLWSDYTGTSLLFWGTSIFYGEISENVPDGAGSCATVHTWYPDSGAVGYLRLDGQWENGVAVGEVAFHDRCTDAADTFTTYDMTATLDGTARSSANIAVPDRRPRRRGKRGKRRRRPRRSSLCTSRRRLRSLSGKCPGLPRWEKWKSHLSRLQREPRNVSQRISPWRPLHRRGKP